MFRSAFGSLAAALVGTQGQNPENAGGVDLGFGNHGQGAGAGQEGAEIAGIVDPIGHAHAVDVESANRVRAVEVEIQRRTGVEVNRV